MNIITFVKRVPSTTTRVLIKDDNALDPTGVEFVLNPYDEFAIEEAIPTLDRPWG